MTDKPLTARIEVFRPGTFTPMGGGDLTFSAADLAAVADAYDAMTSDRVYRPALTKAQAREEILKCRGTQFDPHLTDLMIDIIDQEMKENVS